MLWLRPGAQVVISVTDLVSVLAWGSQGGDDRDETVYGFKKDIECRASQGKL